jgi:hypothetical protein
LFQIDLYIDEKLIVPTDDNSRTIPDYALSVIEGTENTIFALGACWHGKTKEFRLHSILTYSQRIYANIL